MSSFFNLDEYFGFYLFAYFIFIFYNSTVVRYPRVIYPNAYYHIYNRGVNKNAIFFDDADRQQFMKLLAQTVDQYQFHLLAYCLMTNHYHLFVKTRDPNLSDAFWDMKRHFSNYINARHGRVGPLFQGRFKSRLVNHELYGKALIRYIHQNPVDAKIVKKPDDYHWSSYGNYIGTHPAPEWMNVNAGLLFFDEMPEKFNLDES